MGLGSITDASFQHPRYPHSDPGTTDAESDGESDSTSVAVRKRQDLQALDAKKRQPFSSTQKALAQVAARYIRATGDVHFSHEMLVQASGAEEAAAQRIAAMDVAAATAACKAADIMPTLRPVHAPQPPAPSHACSRIRVDIGVVFVRSRSDCAVDYRRRHFGTSWRHWP
jgi:hypothetical protein